MSDHIDLDALRHSIRDVIDAEASSERLHRHYNSGASFDAALSATIAELGWAGLAVPESEGGLGLGIGALAVLYEELGRGPAPVPMLQTLLAADALAQGGSVEQRQRWLPTIVAGECWAAVAPDASAVRVAGDCLHGEVALIPDGAAASFFLIGLADGTWSLVAADDEGVMVEQIPAVDRTRTLATLRLEGTRPDPVAVDAVRLIDHAALGIACDSIGGSAAILERTIAYLKTRIQFGKPIGSFQALKHRIADHKLRLEAASALVAEAVATFGSARGSGLASLAKAGATQAYAAIADDAVQLHGGIGFTWEHDCHIFLKRARFNEQLFGDVEAAFDRAATALVAA